MGTNEQQPETVHVIPKPEREYDQQSGVTTREETMGMRRSGSPVPVNMVRRGDAESR